MDIIIKTGFKQIDSSNIKFQPQTQLKGKKLVDSNHIYNIQEYRTNNVSYKIDCKVIRQASVTKAPYDTTLHIDGDRQITNVACTCIYNKSDRCKHVAALIYFINNESSCSKTDLAQEWGKPTSKQLAQKKYAKGSDFSDMFPSGNRVKGKELPVDFSMLKQPSALKVILDESAKDPEERSIKQLLMHIVDKVELNLSKEVCDECIVQLLILSDNYDVYKEFRCLSKEFEYFYIKYIVMTVDEIKNLCSDTVEQSSTDKWHQARHLRISATKNVHSIKSRVKKSVESLVEDMLHPKNVNTPALRYGRENEENARKQYEILFNVSAIKVGVLVSKHQNWLCASLDGVVLVKDKISRILEIKCPISCRDKSIFDIETQTCNVSYIYVTDGRIKLKKSYIYYTQCQTQIYVAGVKRCDLFLYSPIENGSICIEVVRDEDFIKAVIKSCEYFYFHDYLPALCKTSNATETKTDTRKKFSGKDISNLY